MAILYGTTSAGDTLPVQVDQSGRLVAEGLQGQPGVKGDQGEKGDKGDPGDPGAPGTPGADGSDGADGVGVPQPYGEEGSYLWIKNGQPAWTTGGNTPQPVDDQLILSPGVVSNANNEYAAAALDQNGHVQSWVTDYNAYLRTCDGWSDQPDVTPGYMGFGLKGGGLYEVLYNVEVKNLLGKVCHFGWYGKCTRTPINGETAILQNVIPNQQGVSFIKDSVLGVNNGDNSLSTLLGTTTIFINRDNFTFELRVQITGSYLQAPTGPVLRWFSIEEPTQYLLHEQMKQQRELERLERRIKGKGVTTTDIDPLRSR